MSDNIDGSPLPPGWDRKYDPRTGRFYFINFLNKSTTWEDPRARYRPLPAVAPTGEHIPLQDLSSSVRSTQFQTRNLGPQVNFRSSSPARSIVESTLSTDVDQSVARINAVFPTASETHIRALLLKYLKSVFPKVEETLLLDVLASADNNVQKASEKLITLGFEKIDTPPPRVTLHKKEESEVKEREEKKPVVVAVTPKLISPDDKKKMKAKLQEKYKDIPERVITIALDSVDFDQEKASQILNIMVQEESRPAKKEGESTSVSVQSHTVDAKEKPKSFVEVVEAISAPDVHSTEKSEKTHARRSKGKKDVPKISRGTCTAEDKEFKSFYVQKPFGPNLEFHKGPSDDLLLADYVTWNGPNPNLLTQLGKRRAVYKGPDHSLLGSHRYLPHGPNPSLRKGPMIGLAKGSIYSQLATSKDEESRGK